MNYSVHCPLSADSRLTRVHSAAQGSDASIVGTTEDLYIPNFDANFKSIISLAKVIESYLPKGCRIVFIASAGSRLGVAGQTMYAATKVADETLVHIWVKKLGHSHGIMVK